MWNASVTPVSDIWRRPFKLQQTMNDNIDKALLKSFESDYYTYDFIHTYRSFTNFGKPTKYDFCILTDKSNDKKIIRFQKRWYGVTKKMKAEGIIKPRWIITNSFNLNSRKDLPAFFKILENFRRGKLDEVKQVIENIDFDSQLRQITSLNRDLKKFAKAKAKTGAEKDELEQKQSQINELNIKLKELNDENRQLKIQSFKSNLTKYRKIIKQLKLELSTKAKNESHFQKQLSVHKWIFGPWFEDVISKRKADLENQPDFILKRYDGFADIVEIEAPSKQLFTKPNKSKKTQPRSELIQAFAQIIDYVDSYNDKYKEQLYKDYEDGIDNPLNPYKPRGLLIIGRDKKHERRKLRQLNSFLNNVSMYPSGKIPIG
jgi:hypothetical protein